MGVDISDIQVDLTQHQSELIFGVLEGNLSEFVMIDIIEVTMIEEQVKKNEEEEENRLFKKQSRILPQSEAKYPARTTNTNTITKVSPVNETSSSMEVELRLTQVSLTIFKGTGFTQSGYILLSRKRITILFSDSQKISFLYLEVQLLWYNLCCRI